MKIKLWITLALSLKLLCFSLLANSVEFNPRQSIKLSKAESSKLISNPKRSIKKSSEKPFRSNPRRNIQQSSEKPLQQATGIILAFHKWPSQKEQSHISKRLKKEGLTLTKTFKSFKSLVFSWKQLKTQQRAAKVCLKLSKLQNLDYCEPDALLHPNK